MTSLDQRALRWIVGQDTGLSSETIWAVMMGVPEARDRSYARVPHVPNDFGRCYRLLAVIPEWRDRLDEMLVWFPEWAPFVEYWPDMEALWLEEHNALRAPKLWELMRRLVDESLSIR